MFYGHKPPSFLEYYLKEEWENADTWDRIMCYITWFVFVWNTVRVIYTIILPLYLNFLQKYVIIYLEK